MVRRLTDWMVGSYVGIVTERKDMVSVRVRAVSVKQVLGTGKRAREKEKADTKGRQGKGREQINSLIGNTAGPLDHDR